jgi:hypothetical protein
MQASKGLTVKVTGGTICPHVFFREHAAGQGGKKAPRRIVSFGKAWKAACRAAGCPGRLPHDLRPHGGSELGARRDPGAGGDGDDRPQDPLRV